MATGDMDGPPLDDAPTQRVESGDSDTAAADSVTQRRDPEASLPVAQQIGQYRILRLIGRGGMGAVYEAEQEKPKRIVALKVVNPGIASPKLLKRFEYEAEVLGKLQHPGIAQIYEAGTFDAGNGAQPFFAMELIRGEPLTAYVNRPGLSTRQRLELIVKICDAVQHAHQRGIVHRDLKPGNVMVDGAGHPKVLDFGIARATDGDIQQTTLQTDIGQLIGTIPYMSPEQAGGRPEELDTRSDVYALGVIAYELLAGRLPHNLRDKMIHEAVRIIREDDPTPLSAINRSLRGDVDTIIRKALEKDKTRRYQSASALQADIERYLRNEPIAARPPSQIYQLNKFAKRNRILVGGVTATFVALTAGLIASLILLGQANKAQEAEARQAQIARDNARTAKEAQEAETQRAVELEKVSQFQAKQLSGVDAALMGLRVREDILAGKRDQMETARYNENEIRAAVAELDQRLAGVNFTNIALESLGENILDTALAAIEKEFSDQPLVKAQLLQTLADTLRELGLLDRAIKPQQEALEIHRRMLGDEHPDTLSSINNMGLLLESQGKLAEAELYYREALTTRRRVLGDEHPDTLQSISNMGALLTAQGKLTAAEPYCRQALEARRRVLGDEHPSTLISINNLGALLRAQGKLAEAEPFYRETLETSRRVLGDEHPSTLNAIGAMGTLLHEQGKLAEAEQYFRQALESQRRVLGDEHLSTLISINNMGALLSEQGKLTEAEPYYREGLETRRRVLGDGHPSTLTAISNMGVLLHAQGKLAEAEPYFREALEARRRVLGDEHPDTLTFIANLGVVLQAQGKLAEAEPYHREALEGRKRVLGAEHPSTLTSINNIGFLLLAQGRLAEAEPYYREALEKSRRVLGNEHPDTLTSINNMGLLLKAQGRLAEAETCLREALAGRRRVLGDEHPDTLASINNMGGLRIAQGNFVEALALLAPIEDKARAAFRGGNRFRVAQLLMNLGKARAGLAKSGSEFAAAESLLVEAHAIYVESRGEAHKETRECAQALAEFYAAWDAAEPGDGHQARAAQWRAKVQDNTGPAGAWNADPER